MCIGSGQLWIVHICFCAGSHLKCICKASIRSSWKKVALGGKKNARRYNDANETHYARMLLKFEYTIIFISIITARMIIAPTLTLTKNFRIVSIQRQLCYMPAFTACRPESHRCVVPSTKLILTGLIDLQTKTMEFMNISVDIHLLSAIHNAAIRTHWFE